MESFRDIHSRPIRLTEERQQHLLAAHPEMADTVFRIVETLASPDKIVRSVTDETVELFYRYYPDAPITSKFLCIVVKVVTDEPFAKLWSHGELLRVMG